MAALLLLLFLIPPSEASCETRTGLLYGTGSKDNITVVTSSGVRVFRVVEVVQQKNYIPIVECPAVENFQEAFGFVHGFHCAAGVGSSECGRDFGGFNPMDLQKLDQSAAYFSETSSDGTGSCLAVWDVKHCLAIYPMKGLSTMFPARLASENCKIKVEMLDHHDRKNTPYNNPLDQGQAWNYGRKSSISFKTDCVTDTQEYVIVYDGKIFTEMGSVAAYYSHSCPIYKEIDSNMWNVRKSSFAVSRSDFDVWDIDVEWLGGPSGTNSTATKHDKNWRTSEIIRPKNIAYSVTLCGNEIFENVYVSAYNKECYLYSAVFRSYGHSSQTGNPVAVFYVKCYLAEQYMSCKAKAIVFHQIFDVVFACSGSFELPVSSGGTMLLSSQNNISVPFPTREANDGYGNDLQLTSQPTHASLWNSLGITTPLVSFATSLSKAVPILLGVAVIAMFPGFFQTKIGIIFILFFVWQYSIVKVQANTFQDPAYEFKDELLILSSLAASASGHLAYSILMTTILTFMVTSKTHWLYNIILPIASCSTNMGGDFLRVFWWLVLIRHQEARRMAHETLKDIRYETDLLSTRISGCIPKLNLRTNGFGLFLHRILSGIFGVTILKSSIHGMSLKWFVYDSLGIHKISTFLNGYATSAPLFYHPRRSGTKRNVRNMRGSIFYDFEYDILFPALKNMSEEQIDAMYDRAETVVARPPGDLSWMERNPHQWGHLFPRLSSLTGYRVNKPSIPNLK